MQTSRFYRGWTMAGLALASITLVTGSTTSAFGLFVAPVSDDLGLSRATMNGGMIALHLGMALIAPFVGRLLDRASTRAMMALAGLSLGTAYVLLSTIDALWLKATVLAMLVPFAMLAGGPLAGYVLLARWFRLRRGRAMAVAAFGVALSSVVVTPFLALLIEQLGWRQTLLAWGLTLVALLFLISRFVVDRPTDGEAEPPLRPGVTPAPVHGHTGPPASYARLLRQPALYVMAAVIGISLGIVQALLASLVPLAMGHGLGLMQAASLMSMVGMASILGMLLLAIVADRFDRRILLALCLTIVLAVTLLLRVDGGYALLVASSLLGGLAMGTIFPIYSALIADRFGPGSLGTVEGLITPVIAALSAYAVHFVGASFDATGNYDGALLAFAVALGGALLLLSMLWGGKPRAQPRSIEVHATH